MKYLLVIACFFTSTFLFANRISGVVTDTKGKPLPFASITVKGTTRGTTANNEGKYFIDLNPGTYT
ncbi:MAG: carboxypeptidase regulatory-like domain-containing protein, partial [Daejeonella sp.]